MINETPAAAEQAQAEPTIPYRPLGLKAVIAAALMLQPKQSLKSAG